MKKQLLSVFMALSVCWCIPANAQEENGKDADNLVAKPDHSYKPLTLKLDDSGSKYVRFIIWHQQWLQTNNREVDDLKMQLTSFTRRSRMLAFAQISPRFLILTHFGLNNFGPNNQTSLGNNGDGPQLFLHDAWTEFKVSNNDALHIGTGLHYWKGLTRLANASTLNFMTMDQARPFTHWHSLGVTDQFARHFGVYAKGQIGQFDYRFAINNPLNPANALGAGANYGAAFPNSEASTITYDGAAQIDLDGDPTGNTIVEGYFRYNLFDTESTKLPYQVGTYFGKKKILGFGAGFFRHANGAFDTATGEHENVQHFAADVFYDAPLGDGGINAYAAFQSFDYGDNYVSRWAGTGTNIYVQGGYYIPSLNIMPYFAYQSGSYDALEDNISSMDIGVNYYVSGHNAKITLEYHTIRGDFRDSPGTDGDVTQWRLQTHIFL
ncbi:porin [Fulvivirga lutea]|uniref:Porin n=1 Tax=Fulvivirga lutea TaxID=2810512 RepID=A0A974WHI2_9BACT|nr:porin [Fulvivirga lutea]QSE98476.1 porin [Fulvivirga lutea]